MNNHCNKPIKGKKNGKTFIYYCEVCGQKGEGKTQDDAWGDFMSKEKTTTNEVATIPRNGNQLSSYLNNDSVKNALMARIPTHLKSNAGFNRVMQTNVRYIQTNKNLASLWQTEEGALSIITAYEDAALMLAELGKMGDIVPYGKTCQFIENIEAIEFCLTTGAGAPYEWIEIHLIYENDIVTPGIKNRDYFFECEKIGDPRGEVTQVTVMGKHKKKGVVVGETYDKARLLEKAEQFSKPYKNFLKMKRAYEYAKSEGRVNTDRNGRESFVFFIEKDNDKFFQKSVDNFYAQESAGKLRKDGRGEYAVEVLNKKGGGTWEKKTYRSELEGGVEEKIIYVDELVNPYDGPNQPEMLRKAAGKSFFGKDMKTRNASAAAESFRENPETVEEAFDLSMESAMSQFDEVDDIVVETEVVEDIMDEADYHEQETVDYVPENEKPVQNELEIDD